ncbi:hypothetical protein L7F22_039892 [Adiantum nelumboides]|nr:hypothetical protein [Adiantum nelumboides]
MWGQLSQIDWDVPLLFAGDWNCEDAELQSNEWIASKNKFDAVDVASLQGCDALAYPTWTNRHLKSGFVARRLDRTYLSDKGSWVSHEIQGELMYTHTVSDHTPIRIQFKCKVERTDAWVSAREGILHPVERWQAGMNAIIKLTKAKGKAQARAKRRAKCGLEHVLQCTRAAATQSPNDSITLHLLQVFESTAKDLETQKTEAARVQTNLYWLKTRDAPNKTFFKALRTKKDSELITALRKPDGGVTEDETKIKEMFKDSLSGIVGSPMTWNEQLQQKLNTFLEPMDSKINEEEKLLLGRPFSVYETVVKAMKKEKTPGPDGIQAEVCSPFEKGGWGIPNVINKAQNLLLKWVSKLDSKEPWACIMREKIRDAKLLGHKWSNTHWEDKHFCPVKIKIQNSPALQNITRSWKYKLKNAQWKTGQRFDSSLNQSIWLCRDAMKNCQAAALLNPQLAKTLEKKGYAVFKNIWDAASQDWGIDQRRWRTLKPREKVFLSHVIQGIKEDWPTSFLVATRPSISNWDLKECRRSVPTQSWIRNMVTGWAKEGCFFTSEVCRKKLKQAWKSTSSGRYNLLLWIIIARKISIKALCSRWGKSSPYCPRCHSCRETVKHAFWDCRCISPVRRSCSKLLESYGVTEKITWKQAILGIKGRMNPAMFDIWHFIRASILSRIWYDRNLIAHKKPAMSTDPTQVKVAMVEGCLLAKARPKIRAQASILLKKLRKDPGRHQVTDSVALCCRPTQRMGIMRSWGHWAEKNGNLGAPSHEERHLGGQLGRLDVGGMRGSLGGATWPTPWQAKVGFGEGQAGRGFAATSRLPWQADRADASEFCFAGESF